MSGQRFSSESVLIHSKDAPEAQPVGSQRCNVWKVDHGFVRSEGALLPRLQRGNGVRIDSRGFTSGYLLLAASRRNSIPQYPAGDIFLIRAGGNLYRSLTPEI